jgi:hypothetical protein
VRTRQIHSIDSNRFIRSILYMNSFVGHNHSCTNSTKRIMNSRSSSSSSVVDLPPPADVPHAPVVLDDDGVDDYEDPGRSRSLSMVYWSCYSGRRLPQSRVSLPENGRIHDVRSNDDALPYS